MLHFINEVNTQVPGTNFQVLGNNLKLIKSASISKIHAWVNYGAACVATIVILLP